MRFRFTVRELLLMVAIVGLSLGWWLDHLAGERLRRNAEFTAWQQAEKSTRLIDAISRLGGDAATLPETFHRSGFDEDLDPSLGYNDVTKLADAVALAQSNLERDGRGEYAVLLSEDRVRAAIANAIRRRDAQVAMEELQNPGTKTAWETARPIFVAIAENGAWPKGCEFDMQYSVYAENNGNLTSYQGLRVVLRVSNWLAELPIIEVMFRK